MKKRKKRRKWKFKKTVKYFLIGYLIIIIPIVIYFIIVNYIIEIKIIGDSKIVLDYGEKYSEPGYKGKKINKDITDKIVVEDNVKSKIGNYNEDLFGKELVEKVKTAKKDPKMYLSENHDSYCDFRFRKEIHHAPKLGTKDLSSSTSSNSPRFSNFDINIDFTNKTLNGQIKPNENNGLVRNRSCMDIRNNEYNNSNSLTNLPNIQNKTLINLIDGKDVGNIIDVSIDNEGKIDGLVVEKKRFLISRFITVYMERLKVMSFLSSLQIILLRWWTAVLQPGMGLTRLLLSIKLRRVRVCRII